MVYTYEADTLVFQVFVSKSVVSLNGLSIASAKPTPQPCVLVLMVQGIKEMLSGQNKGENNLQSGSEK